MNAVRGFTTAFQQQLGNTGGIVAMLVILLGTVIAVILDILCRNGVICVPVNVLNDISETVQCVINATVS